MMCTWNTKFTIILKQCVYLNTQQVHLCVNFILYFIVYSKSYQLNMSIRVLFSRVGWDSICHSFAFDSSFSGLSRSLVGSRRCDGMVFWLTFAACSRIVLESSIRPLLISQRGDSGKHLKKILRETFWNQNINVDQTKWWWLCLFVYYLCDVIIQAYICKQLDPKVIKKTFIHANLNDHEFYLAHRC